MVYNYLKTAFRNLWRKRQISLINFIGMWVALTVVLLIFLFVRDERSFDHFHDQKRDIYRITNYSINGFFSDYQSGFTGIPQGPTFTEDWSFFVFGGLGTCLLTALTLGREAVVYASANPVDSIQQD